MKTGLSTYSLLKAIQAGEMDVIGAIQWIKDNGGESVELSPWGWPKQLSESPDLIDAIVDKCGSIGLALAGYSIGADFLKDTEGQYRAEIDRVKKEVDIGGALGVKFMRHDAGARPRESISVKQFNEDLPKLADACREIADHAKQYGITTSVENHDFYVQGSERLQRLVLAVDRDNFRTTLDAGNFLCVDEDPVAAVQNNLPFASNIHMKDFYVRDSVPCADCGGWIRTTHGRYLRGAIVGFGDIDIPRIIGIIKAFGYDGYISIEFEGAEDCRTASRMGMDNVRKLWNEA